MAQIHPIVWITGQPGAGKSTLSRALLAHWQVLDERAFIVDGDDLRALTQNVDYSRAGREANIQRAQDIAQFLAGQGCRVVVAVVAPYRALREDFKLRTQVREVYVHTSKPRGREHFHSEDYEQPLEGFVEIDTTTSSPDESLSELLEKLQIP
jgi:adenylylsulfate kinase-like enzyme